MRKMNWLKYSISAVVGVTASVTLVPKPAVAALFGTGDIVVERIGTGASALTSGAQSVFLDEYTPAGALVQSIAMPTTTVGGQAALTESGTATSDGMINLSVDGHYLTLVGYKAALGTATVSTTSSTTVPRVIGRVDASGNVDTSTQVSIGSGDNIRSAITTDGSAFWIASGGTAPDRGVFYATFGSTSATNLGVSGISGKDVDIFANTLYASNSTGSNTDVVQVGSLGTLPTATVSLTQLTGLPTGASPHEIALLHMGPTGSALDTMYIADDTGNALSKYGLVAGTWTLQGKVGAGADDYTGLTAVQSGSTVTLYATLLKGDATAGSVAQLVSLTDSSGFGGTLTGTPTLLATAGANETFAGVSLAPTAAPVPEPSTFALAAVSAIFAFGLGLRRRMR